MQETSLKQKINPGFDFSSEKEIQISHDFLSIMENSSHNQDLMKLEEFQITENDLEDYDEEDEEEEEEEEEENDEEDEEEEDFSFVCVGEDAAAIAAEDAFSNGQIKSTVFPLFDQSLIFRGDDHDSDSSLPMRPHVKNVFVEGNRAVGKAVTSSAPENDEIAGPCCEWSSKKAAPEVICKKSNSTGFSKIWRLKELTARSNSDGRDAFVFLNGGHAPPAAKQQPAAAVEKKKEPAVAKVKKSGKGKTAAVSAHEVYLKSKAKDEERRRSYLPYRPELMGFFTNVNGGLTRNVHPF